jgi:hypothetical protein
MSDNGAALRAFPADGFTARWATADGEHTETLTLTWENEAWTATGNVEREDVDYVIRLSPLWQVRQFLLFRDLAEPDLWLGTDGGGRWGEVNGAHRPELDGALDISLACTPFTHSLPIRRLPLNVGDAAETSLLQVDVDTLGVVPTTAVYERLAPRRWRVARGSQTTEFDVDDYGLALDVPGEFRRTG